MVRWNADYDFSDAAYDSVQERMIITTRQGDMLALDKNGKEEVLFKGNGTEIPWNVTVDKYGQIYFQRRLCMAGFRTSGTGKIRL